jgi:hypothetical protein
MFENASPIESGEANGREQSITVKRTGHNRMVVEFTMLNENELFSAPSAPKRSTILKKALALKRRNG